MMPLRPARPAVLLCGVLLCAMLSACGTARPSPDAMATVAYMPDGAAGASEDGMMRARQPSDASNPDRQLVRTATLDLSVESERDIPAAMEQTGALVTSLGGYVATEAPRQMTLRIPDDRLDEALARLSELGDVDRREVRVVDVTAAYTDLQIRLDNARALQTRLRALLDSAATVADVLAVERELARATTEVETLEGQMRLLQSQIRFSTVYFTVHDDVDPGPVGWVFVGLYETVKWLFVWD